MHENRDAKHRRINSGCIIGGDREQVIANQSWGPARDGHVPMVSRSFSGADINWDLALGPLRSAKTGNQTFGSHRRDGDIRQQSGHSQFKTRSSEAALHS